MFALYSACRAKQHKDKTINLLTATYEQGTRLVLAQRLCYKNLGDQCFQKSKYAIPTQHWKTFEVCTLRFLFFLLQSFCLKSQNQNSNNNNNNNNNSYKNPHKLFVVLQLSTSGIPVTFSSICTAIKQEKLKNAVHES